MKIGINTRLLIKGKMDGIAWFSYETIRRMVANHPEIEFVFFFDRKPSKEFIFEAYHHAVEEQYRFFSFGDAMLIL